MNFLLCLLIFTVTATQLFAAGKQLTGQHAPTTSPALSPADAEKAFKVPDGFEVRLFAAEPDVINPVAMTWDERGRLWVLELYEYPLGAPAGQKGRDRIKILEDTDGDGRADKVTVFADGFSLATGLLLGNGGVYVGQAPDLLFLRDTNHDDHADTRETLLTGFGMQDRHELLNGFTWGPDGWLYMTHGVFNKSVVHEPGAEERGLQAASTSSATNNVKRPEGRAPFEGGVEMTAAVARFDPRTKKFEIFADGTSNPWGVDFDRYGNAFVSACVIDHLFHIAPGGIYQRQGGVPENPYSYELLPSIVDHKHYMAAYCGICIYQGNNFPSEYQGHVFMGNIHQSAINHDRLIPNGSSFKAVAEPDFLTTSDGWFRPISEQVGPDGALWIADWYDKYPCYQNAQADPEGVDRERGRIWRVVYVGKEKGKKIPSRPELEMDLRKLNVPRLVQLLEHSNEWQRRSAQRLLTEFLKTESQGLPISAETKMWSPSLDKIPQDLEEVGLNAKFLDTRISALSILDSINWSRMELHKLEKLLIDPEPSVRKIAVKIATHVFEENQKRIKNWSEAQRLHQPTRERLIKPFVNAQEKIQAALKNAALDADPSVRLGIAIICRQFVSSSLTVDTDININAPIGKILGALIKSSSDAKDPLLPYMIWMAGEPTFALNPKSGLQWLAENGPSTMPLSGILVRKAMRRICDTGEAAKLDTAVEFLTTLCSSRREEAHSEKGQSLVTSAATDGLVLATLDGLIEGQRAKPLLPSVETKSLLAKLSSSSNMQIQERAQKLGTLWGDAVATEKTLAAINDPKAPLEERIKAVQSAQQLKNVSSREALLQVISSDAPEALMIEALHSLSAIGNEESGEKVVQNWSKFSANTRRAAVDMLASRGIWVRHLIAALEDKIILPQEISASVARTLATSKNPNFAARAQRLLGRFREADADKLKIIAQKKQMILSAEPNIAHGHEVAKKTCFVCHKLHGEGAEVGPDLTGVGRSTLDALLANVIDPNQVVGKGYENVEIETKDGRTVSGRLVEDTDSHVKLISAGPKEDVIAKSDIESKRVSELSVMPEGLEQMPDGDFRDLIWFILNPPADNRPMTPELRAQLIGK